ncbi:methionyl-tRNA formyltransferase [Candidatus Peribacteria bacterium RIFCSPHIGHO2_02_FULL_49_16]|nr:MAG: methionyl-tRNA formyltransferase [Candidatus Peribacteria bacterium RIFCSPHIGHO2_01_FULL_49_38]OGJ58533.1 MAG: methionyl-tRNA formyltransferase [Candidatus Peribacteria bacterium RIFCSPHIGHO2_02_FULL_49_16]
MHPFSLVFCGTPAFALPSLHILCSDPAFDVKLVITQPDKPIGRDKNLHSPPVKHVAEKYGIKVLQPKNMNKELSSINDQLSSRPDFLVVVAYGQILSQEILDIPAIAPVNIHASLLPRWRGASPLQHTILHGDTVGGVTIQRMEYALDAGPILAQKSLFLDPRETTVTLRDKLSTLGAELLQKTLKEPLHPESQDPTKVTMCHKLTRADGHVQTETMTAEEIDRSVRALVPWPGVTLFNQTVKILETALEPMEHAYPIPCAENTILYLVTVQPPGKKPMTGAAWARGRPTPS